MNRLAGADVQVTRELRADGRGRHTTTRRELVRLPGGAWLVDTPGLRELQLWAGADAAEDAFEDVDQLAAGCRFRDCAHKAEPGCAVQAAVDAGTLELARLRNYRRLQAELARLERKRDERLLQEARREHKRRVRIQARAMRRR